MSVIGERRAYAWSDEGDHMSLSQTREAGSGVEVAYLLMTLNA